MDRTDTPQKLPQMEFLFYFENPPIERERSNDTVDSIIMRRRKKSKKSKKKIKKPRPILDNNHDDEDDNDSGLDSPQICGKENVLPDNSPEIASFKTIGEGGVKIATKFQSKETGWMKLGIAFLGQASAKPICKLRPLFDGIKTEASSTSDSSEFTSVFQILYYLLLFTLLGMILVIFGCSLWSAMTTSIAMTLFIASLRSVKTKKDLDDTQRMLTTKLQAPENDDDVDEPEEDDDKNAIPEDSDEDVESMARPLDRIDSVFVDNPPEMGPNYQTGPAAVKIPPKIFPQQPLLKTEAIRSAELFKFSSDPDRRTMYDGLNLEVLCHNKKCKWYSLPQILHVGDGIIDMRKTMIRVKCLKCGEFVYNEKEKWKYILRVGFTNCKVKYHCVKEKSRKRESSKWIYVPLKPCWMDGYINEITAPKYREFKWEVKLVKLK